MEDMQFQNNKVFNNQDHNTKGTLDEYLNITSNYSPSMVISDIQDSQVKIDSRNQDFKQQKKDLNSNMNLSQFQVNLQHNHKQPHQSYQQQGMKNNYKQGQQQYYQNNRRNQNGRYFFKNKKHRINWQRPFQKSQSTEKHYNQLETGLFRNQMIKHQVEQSIEDLSRKSQQQNESFKSIIKPFNLEQIQEQQLRDELTRNSQIISNKLKDDNKVNNSM
eukprot:403372666